MKRKMVRKIVYDSITRMKLRIERIKWEKNLIEPVIHVNDVPLDEAALTLSKWVKQQWVMMRMRRNVRDIRTITY